MAARRVAPSPLPGDCEGDQVSYAGSSETFTSDYKLSHGQAGGKMLKGDSVVGAADDSGRLYDFPPHDERFRAARQAQEAARRAARVRVARV